MAYEILSNNNTRKNYDKYIYSLYFDSEINNNNDIKPNSNYYENHEREDSFFSKYKGNKDTSSQSFFYSNMNNNPNNFYFKNSKSTFTFIDPKTGKMHRININKAKKINNFSSEDFYANEEANRRMRDTRNNNCNQFYYHENSEKKDAYYNYGFNSGDNIYNDVKGKKTDYSDYVGNNQDPHQNNRYKPNEDKSYIGNIDPKYYLILACIPLAILSLAMRIKQMPASNEPFIYQNSVYYPKSKDPILEELIKSGKVDYFMLKRINNK